MDNSSQAKILLEHLDWNIKHLREILKNPKTIYYRNASIQRFRFTVDLSLKCFENMLEPNKKKHSDPKFLFQAAFEMQWFEDIDLWENVIQNYEQAKKGFKNDEAEIVYSNLHEHLIFFQKLHKKLSTIPIQNNPIQTK